MVLQVEKILRDVDLLDKADVYTKNLSGGQKRKLSVGIAFIGDPKVHQTQRIDISTSTARAALNIS